MKKYNNPELEITLLTDGDILTFSIGELEGLDPSGSDGPIIDVPEESSDIASNFK